jgi:cellulose biosynthesis protein BcsQ
MKDALLQYISWFLAKWSKWGWFRRILAAAVLFLLVGGIAVGLANIGPLREAFALASPFVQLALLFALVTVIVGVIAIGLVKAQESKQLSEDKAKAEERAEVAEQEAARLQAQWDHLLDAGCRDSLWKRAPAVASPFVPKANRKTRFVTLLNLKGGVGKTTLAANLAAGLATGGAPLRVLLVDLDFQSTLSRATVEGTLLKEKEKHGAFVQQLFAPTQEPALVKRLCAPMCGVALAQVVQSDENLDTVEFQLQARFYVDPTNDPRFRFVTQLHQPAVFEEFDVVIFDSPPRVTASVVNALACSDFVLIPTKLDHGSMNAIPRTVSWMKSLGDVCRAEVLGVVASHVGIRAGKLVRADNDSYAQLRQLVESECGDARKLLKSAVQFSAKAVGTDAEIGSLTADGEKVFAAVVRELRTRMGL